jgi:hypothetical protein
MAQRKMTVKSRLKGVVVFKRIFEWIISKILCKANRIWNANRPSASFRAFFQVFYILPRRFYSSLFENVVKGGIGFKAAFPRVYGQC